MVDGLIGQLMFSFGKIITLVQDDHGAAFIGKEDDDIGNGA